MQNSDTLTPVQIFFRNKWVRLCIILNVLLILIIISILIVHSTKVSTINFDITPLNSIISINNQQYTNGQYSITPGTYTVNVSHDNLTPKSFTVDISPQEIVTISTFLKDNDNTFDFYKQKENYMSYRKLMDIASNNNNTTTDHDTSAEAFITNFNKQYTLIDTSLPIRYADYKHNPEGWDSLIEQIIIIKPNQNDHCTKTLCVKALMGLSDNKGLVSKLLNEKGLDLNEVEVLYEKN